MEIIRDIDQGSEEWHLLRLGSVGGSSMNSVLAKGKGETRQKLLYQLAAEILTGNKTNTYNTPAMERGTELEPEARRHYEMLTFTDVEQVCLIKSDVPRVHVSPDGLVGDDGGIEIKCPLPTTHIETIDTGKIDIKYIRQCQHFLWVTGRQWIDFVSYCPEIEARPMWIARQYPDQKIHADISREVPIFMDDLNRLIERIKRGDA